MRNIILVLGNPSVNDMEITIVDVTDAKEKKRGKITAEYARIDLKPMIDRKASLEEAVEEYNIWINKTLRRYLLDDCNIIEGKEEFLSIIREHIKKYFE